MGRVIITGLHGTVAPVVADYFASKGYDIVPFDRGIVNIDDEQAVRAFIVGEAPEILLHFALGSEKWAADMAKICFEMGIKFAFSSTVDTLSDMSNGPYTPQTKPWSKTDYGRYKIRCEELIRSANPNAYIIRLGWQIGDSSGSNNMIDFLTRQMNENGVISASRRWYPSCSFITDTALGIYYLLHEAPPDTYLINSNDELSFYEIVEMLSERHSSFKLKEDSSFVRDDRMFDPRVKYIAHFKRGDSIN